MSLKTRQPTGAVPWPLVLIEGEEKAGKTWACAEFTASPRVGRCFWIDLGEGAADEYGAIPGAHYEIVEHDGSFAALVANVTEIRDIAAQALAAGDKPVVLVIDTMTEEWAILSDWARDCARASKANKRKLAEDPNAEIIVSSNYWNNANARHRQLMRMLKKFPGIVLMTSHGKLTAVIGPDGQPVEGKKEHKVEAQKTLGADASCWLRLYRNEPGVIVGGRSVHVKFRPGEEPRRLAADWSLEGIIFDVLKCDPAVAQVRDLADRVPDMVDPDVIRRDAVDPWTAVERIRELYTLAKRARFDEVTVLNENSREELILTMLGRIGKARADARAALAEPDGWLDAIATIGSPDDAKKVRDEINAAFTGKKVPDSDPRLMGLREAWAARVREISQGGETEQPRPASAVQPALDGTLTEPEWVGDFMAKLADTDSDGLLSLRREEIQFALANKIIPARTASELLAVVDDKSRQVREARNAEALPV
jgi:hypothetical protein